MKHLYNPGFAALLSILMIFPSRVHSQSPPVTSIGLATYVNGAYSVPIVVTGFSNAGDISFTVNYNPAEIIFAGVDLNTGLSASRAIMTGPADQSGAIKFSYTSPSAIILLNPVTTLLRLKFTIRPGIEGTRSLLTWNTAQGACDITPPAPGAYQPPIDPSNFPRYFIGGYIDIPHVHPAIDGPATACAGSTKTYTTQIGKTNYVWSVSPGGEIKSGGTSADWMAVIKWNVPGAQTVSVNYTSAGVTPPNPTTYSVVVSDCGGQLHLSTSVTDIHCSGAKPGAIDLTVTGGTKPYSYLWSNGATSQDLAGLTVPGTYSVMVKDYYGTIATASATVKMTANPDAVILSPSYVRPVCGAFESNILKAAPSGQADLKYMWSVSNPAWSITGSRTETQIRFASSTTPATFTLSVTDRYGCTSIATYTMNGCIPESYCTYARSFYTNKNGTACDVNGGPISPKDIMIRSFGSNSTLTFGALPGTTGFRFTLRKQEVTSEFIFKMMSGTSNPRALTGNATSDPLSRTGWQYVPISTSRNLFGTIQNDLLTQIMALCFNLSNEPGLGQLQLKGQVLCTAASQNCGSSYPKLFSTRLFVIPQSVCKYLGSTKTVADLYGLANRILGGEKVPKVSVNDITSAVDAINRGFDRCRILIDFYSAAICDLKEFSGKTDPISENENIETPDNYRKTKRTDDVTLSVYPNPFKTSASFSIEAEKDTHVRLEVLSNSGILLRVLLDQNMVQGERTNVDFNSESLPASTFIYRLSTNGRDIKGTLVKTR